MGTWGPGIFSDDVACDVRDVYRDLLGDQVPDQDAEREALETLSEDGHVPNVVWLALAATESRLGRLSDRVRGEALAIIEEGRDLAEWQDASPADRRKRENALKRLKDQLEGAQPLPRKVRREWKYRTGLDAGDVLAVQIEGCHTRLLRIVDVRRDERSGDWPLVELLQYDRPAAPSMSLVDELPAATKTWRETSRACRWNVANNHSYEPDWKAAGFVLLGRIARRPGDAEALDRTRIDRDVEAALARLDDANGEPEPNGLDTALEEALAESNDPPFSTWGYLPQELSAVKLT